VPEPYSPRYLLAKIRQYLLHGLRIAVLHISAFDAVDGSSTGDSLCRPATVSVVEAGTVPLNSQMRWSQWLGEANYSVLPSLSAFEQRLNSSHTH
jgi:hypothetical protein